MDERDDDLDSVVDDDLTGDDLTGDDVFEGVEEDDALVDGSVEDVVEDVDAESDDEDAEPTLDPVGLDAVGDRDDDDGSGDPPVDLALLEDLEVAVDLADDEDDDLDDVVTPDEFVCRSCHMAKRWSALADEDAMLCRDCA